MVTIYDNFVEMYSINLSGSTTTLKSGLPVLFDRHIVTLFSKFP